MCTDQGGVMVVRKVSVRTDLHVYICFDLYVLISVCVLIGVCGS